MPENHSQGLMGCMNGHEPEYIETRPSGARVCKKCTTLYNSRNRIQGYRVAPTRTKETKNEPTRSR